LFAEDDQAGEEAKPAAVPPAASKGVAPRNAWFLSQYEGRGTDTYHKPAKIHAKWQAMKTTERAAICPDSPNQIAKATIAKIIKLAKRRKA
jgi:hypothetical protein